MIYDILVVAILIMSVVIGYSRGAAKTIISLITFVLSLSLSVYIGGLISDFIYDGYIKQAIIDSVTQSVVDSGALNVANATLPPFVSFSMMLTGFDYMSALENSVNTLPDAIATGFETALRPVVTSVLTFVMTAITFLILYFVFRFIVIKLLNFVFNLPIIRGVNKFFGAIFGFLTALFVISFLAFLLTLVMPYIENMPYWLSESTIYNSYIFYHFYSGNIFNNLISVF